MCPDCNENQMNIFDDSYGINGRYEIVLAMVG
jgi:hypothetical protein